MSFALVDFVPWVPVIGLVMTGVFYYLRLKRSSASKASLPAPPGVVINNSNVQGNAVEVPSSAPGEKKSKGAVSILFVDDDVKFKVVNILRNEGWKNAKIIKDITSLEQPEVLAADILFVDIQGVGRALAFKDEGLGLVVALKKRFAAKKVVIYSAESGLNPFHSAFKVADDQISKDADPYEFIDTVERLSGV